MNLGDLLFEPGEGSPGDSDVLVYAGGQSWTVSEIRHRAVALSDLLGSHGAEAGTRVAVSLPNGPELVAALFGVWRAGCTYVPVNPRLADAEVQHVLDTVDAAVWVTSDGSEDRAPESLAVMVAAEDGWQPVRQSGSQQAAVGDDGIALIQFTSGTTGRPKPVMLRHDGVLELLDGVVRKLRGVRGGSSTGAADPSVSRAERGVRGGSSTGAAKAPMPNLIPVSLSLWAGIYNVLFAMRVGAPVVLMDQFEPRRFEELVNRFGIRSTVLPPAAMAMLTDSPDVGDLAPLRYVRSITAPLSPSQARRFHERFGISVLNSYGQTEIGGEIIGWNAQDAREHGEDKLGSVGRPHNGVSVRVVDPEEVEAAPGGHGEIRVRTPAMSAGYADGASLADRLDAEGWFRTGDLGFVDTDGFVWIDGRASDMINRGGLKFYPAEVEEVLRTAPGVADAAVVGVADERLGEVPVAFVVLDDGVSVGATGGLESHCRESMAPYKVPVAFEVVDALPRNEIGKLLRNELVASKREDS